LHFFSFLASVEAFNNLNEFITLDDVISFDSNHRKRFADFFEKDSQISIILLTHEEEWFRSFVKPLARNGWFVNEI
jgi:wobble nucleotide-excising tRNase